MRLYLPHVMNVNGWMSECTCLASRPKIYIRVRNRNQLQSEAAAKSTLLVGLRQSRAEQSWAADVCADIGLSFPGVGGTQRQEGALAGSFDPRSLCFSLIFTLHSLSAFPMPVKTLEARLSPALVSSGDPTCHITQKKLWKPSNSSRGYYLQYPKKRLSSLPHWERQPSVSWKCLSQFAPRPMSVFHFSHCFSPAFTFLKDMSLSSCPSELPKSPPPIAPRPTSPPLL